MGKVRVTLEQAEAISKFQEMVNSLGISTEKFIHAFEKGYEVEPDLKEGDWVIWNHEDEKLRLIGQLVQEENQLRVKDLKYDVPQLVPLSRLRHATEEEIQQEKEHRKWDEINRSVDEFHVNDIIKDKSGNYGFMYRQILSMNPVYQTARCTGGVDIHYSDLKLVCPSNERFDLS